MTRIYRSLGTLAATTAISLALLAGTLIAPAIAQTSPHLSKQELKSLATAPGGHERLATYYRDQAQQLRDKAQKFSAQADYLATQPALIESKQGISCNCTIHYRYFSKLYAEQANDADALAAQQEQLSGKTNR